ncbi:hypothetical protein PoB_007584700 [Plakobranchus ocellatus]|uniref:Uncharacterized protein n=1 Tax=Plakobranchus ocellatus TaxID=259542 RepID=A0AAV4DZ79_9GAST|nr:hypothetical protein PoB_007584700 [Plakobranchus ocellatus]
MPRRGAFMIVEQAFHLLINTNDDEFSDNDSELDLAHSHEISLLVPTTPAFLSTLDVSSASPLRSDVPSAISTTSGLPSVIPSIRDGPSNILFTSDGSCVEDDNIPPKVASCLRSLLKSAIRQCTTFYL